MDHLAEPPRKRRRPALSCVECRRRKIKCSRTHPCTQCTLSKSITCSYVPSSTPSNGTSSKATNPSATHNHPPPLSSIAGDVSCSPSEHLPHKTPAPPFLTPGSSPSNSNDRIHSTAGSSWAHPMNGSSISRGAEPVIASTSGTVIPSPLRDETISDDSNKFDTVVNFGGQGNPRQHILSKTRLFGQSHWMTYAGQFEKFCEFTELADLNTTSTVSSGSKVAEIYALVVKCKKLVRVAKSSRPNTASSFSELKSYIPRQELAEKLVHNYLRTFESTYRILHIPTFLQEYAAYWTNPEASTAQFVVKLLLVMAIGSCFYENPDDEAQIRQDALHWICAANSWLTGPWEKKRLNLNALQAYCLYLLARQTNAVAGDLAWLSVGHVLRVAFVMGLHRDPKHFPKMSNLHTQLRRRLWATIVEFAIQTSLDSGMPPLISITDFDTEPPSNLDDEDIDDKLNSVLTPKCPGIYTQTSLQIALLDSLKTRLEVCKFLNDLHPAPAYDDALKLTSELNSICQETMSKFNKFQCPTLQEASKPTTFHRNLMDLFLRRFLLALHRPFAPRAREDPRFYFSRKVCLETAIFIASPEPDSDFERLMIFGQGVFRDGMAHGGQALFLEYVTQLEEDKLDARLERNKARRKPIRDILATTITVAEKRVAMGDYNIKGHVFYSIMMAQVDAIESGTSQDELMLERGKASADLCYELLKTRSSALHASSEPIADFVEPLAMENSVEGGLDGLGFGSWTDADFLFENPSSWLLPAWGGVFNS